MPLVHEAHLTDNPGYIRFIPAYVDHAIREIYHNP